MYRLIGLLFFNFIVLNIQAQEAESIKNTDAITYDLYSKNEWKQLIEFSKRAINRKEDFFYLRMRIGIAYYELKEYRNALVHFEKASQMEGQNELLKEYLYYCYLFTEQFPQALKLSEEFSKETLSTTKMENPSGIFYSNVEYGNKLSSDTSMYKSLSYFQVGLGFRLGKSLTAYAAISNLSQQMYYGTISQQQLYVSLTIPLKHSWLLMPAFHYLNYTYSNLLVPPATITNPKANNLDGTGSVYSFSASKNWKDFLFTGTASYSTLNNAKQYQQQVSVNWYPLHNNRLSFNGSLLLFSNDSGTTAKVIPSFGGKYFLNSKVSLAGYFTSFDVKNYNELNGQVANNSDDITHIRYTGLAEWNCYKNISVFGVYSHESKTEKVSEKTYTYTTVIGGIKIIF